MMLLNRLQGLKVFLLIHLLLFCITLLAQPANDRCSSPTLLDIGLNAETCIPIRGDTRGTEDATLVEEAPEVCSGSWFTDDVWYSFTTGDITPPFGVTVEVRLDSAIDTELIEHGMAIYADCDEDTKPIDCFSDVPGRRTIQYPPTCLEPNATYFIRIWSAPEPRTNEGTFSICAYEAPEEITNPNDPKPRIIYEETFDEGFNGWESVSQTQSLNIFTGEFVDDHWLWTNTGCFKNSFGSQTCLLEDFATCTESSVIGVPSGFYLCDWQTCNGISSPPYPKVNTYIVSPPINLSKENCVNLNWIESARFFEGDSISPLGAYVQYSLDDGKTWINPSTAIGTADVTQNYGGNYSKNIAATNALARSIPLIGAEGNENVRIRFGFEGDFYFWIVDNIRIVEGIRVDGIAQNNSIARAHINPMSIHMVDSYDFSIDIANISCEDLTNTAVNMTITNNLGEVKHNVNLSYGTIASDSLAKSKAFNQAFTPAPVVGDYTNTYTLLADRDDDISNNIRTFQTSVVDEMVFRKENGMPNGALSPNTDLFWNKDEAFNWEMGNIFFAPNGTAVTGKQLRFNEISFQIDNPFRLSNDLLRIWLYEINDQNFDNIIHKDDASEIKILGFSEYRLTGMEHEMITVQLESFTGIEEDLNIKPNKHYMATVENATQVIRRDVMAIGSDDTYDYSAALYLAQQKGLSTGNLADMRYAHSFSISKENYFRIGPGNSGDLTTGNFSAATTPVIRLGFGEIPTISTVDINKEIELSLSPNPTASQLTLNLSIEEAIDMEISIVDLTGKVVSRNSLKSVTDLREKFDVSHLSDGVYMIHIDTKDGVQTEKFVVSK